MFAEVYQFYSNHSRVDVFFVRDNYMREHIDYCTDGKMTVHTLNSQSCIVGPEEPYDTVWKCNQRRYH